MAKNMSFLVCLLIMAVDIVAGILSIEAEITNKVSHRQSVQTTSLKMWIFECRDTSHGAFKQFESRAMLLVAAHALTNLLGGCMRVRSKEELDRATANKQLAVASLILSWIVLIMGLRSNSKTWRSCRLAHQRQLSIGGVLCFVHGLFGMTYFVSASAERKEEKMGRQSDGPV